MKYQDAGVNLLLKKAILTIQSLLFLHFLLCSIIFSFFFNLVYKPIPMFSNWTAGLLLLPSFIPVSQDFFWLLYNYLKKRHSKYQWYLNVQCYFNLMGASRNHILSFKYLFRGKKGSKPYINECFSSIGKISSKGTRTKRNIWNRYCLRSNGLNVCNKLLVQRRKLNRCK